MHVFMEHNGVKVRVNCGQPPSLETQNAIKKLVECVINQQTNGNHQGETIDHAEDISGSQYGSSQI